MSHTFTTQAEVRRAFWQGAPAEMRKRVPAFDGNGRMYNATTRTEFVDFVDMLAKDGLISETLAQRVTLEG